MKWELRVFFCGLVLQAGLSFCLAHENTKVHPKITASAAESSMGLKTFLSDGYGNAGLTYPALRFTEERWFYGTNGTMSPKEWLETGSMFEDIPFWRGLNHFYDPIHGKIGLTDGFDAFAFSSFEWATKEVHQSGEPSYPWKIVRAYELNALTNSMETERKASLAGMMCCLGHVIHLNQDLTVPAHVRNDNHGLTLQHGARETFIMWTEIYGKNNYSTQEMAKAFPIQTNHQGWLWWQNTAGFKKLEDFWSRDILLTFA